MTDKKVIDSRIAILDPLRFIAALLVLFYHYLPFIQNEFGTHRFDFFELGYLGVNFFFMLSGFVIMASAQNRSAIKFALLRALRLSPAFIVCMLVTLIVMYLSNISLPSIVAIVLNGLIINDYFGVPNIDGVYWTLQAELKFYGCIFLLIMFGQIHNYKIWLTIWLILAALYHFTKQPFFIGWFISPSYSFYFIGGIAAFLLYQKPKDRFALLVMGVAMIFAMLESWMQIDGFVRQVKNSDRFCAVVITALFFIFFLCLKKVNQYVRYYKFMALLGGISYPLYLIHSRAGKVMLNYFDGYLSAPLSLVVTILFLLSIAVAVHTLIEKPFFRAVRHKVS